MRVRLAMREPMASKRRVATGRPRPHAGAGQRPSAEGHTAKPFCTASSASAACAAAAYARRPKPARGASTHTQA